MIKNIIFFFVLLTAIPLCLFVILNPTKVEYNFWILKYETYAWLPVVAAFFLGIIGTAIFSTLSASLWKIKARTLEKQLNNLHKENQKKEIKKEFQADAKKTEVTPA